MVYNSPIFIESYSSPLNIEMKAMRAGSSVPIPYEIQRFASIRRCNDVNFFCGGYMITRIIVAARAHCVLVENPE